MNKRGEQQSSSTGAIIAAIVAVAVLVIVVLAIWMFYSGKINFFESIPSFNQTKPRIITSEIFRYYLPEDKLQVYDGTSWVDIGEKGIDVNDKKLEYVKLYGELTESYIGKTKEFQGGIVAFIEKANFATNAYLYGGGSIAIVKSPIDMSKPRAVLDIKDDTLYITGARSVFAGTVLRIVGWLSPSTSRTNYYHEADIPKDTETILGLNEGDYLKTEREIIEWRDSLITNSVEISYIDPNGNRQKVTTCYISSKYFEEKNKALVVDLSRPLPVGGTCPYIN